MNSIGVSVKGSPAIVKPATGAFNTSMVCVMVLLHPFCANTVKVAKYCPWVSKLVVVCGPVPLVPLPKLQFHPMIGAPVVVLVLVNTICDPAHALLQVKSASSGLKKDSITVSPAAAHTPLPDATPPSH